MVNSSINISSLGGQLITTTTSVSSAMPQITGGKIGISVVVSDTSGDIVNASLNINNSSLKLEILNSQEYYKKASLFFGTLFQGGLNEEYLWELLASPTSQQVNASHLSGALSEINSSIQDLSGDLHSHETNYNIHVNQEDRDFLTRLKGLYGGVYNVALDYLVLKNPYLGDINLTQNQLALYAGFGGFSAYSGETEIEIEFFNLLYIPTKSGGYPTSEAYHAQNNTYGYGITTLNVPTAEPLDLVEGETAIFVGAGGFNSYSSSNTDSDVVVGYYFEGNFYLDQAHTIPATLNPALIYVDLGENKLYRYDSTEAAFIPLTANGGVTEGFFNDIDGKFYESYVEGTYSDEITGEAGILYLDKTTNTLYRYDSTNGFVAVSSASQDAFIIRGYRKSDNGLFYKDLLYEEAITGDVNCLYYDLLTSEVYYYSQNAFIRLHHKVAVDYLLFKPQSSSFTVPEGKVALYFGEGGFNAADLYTEEKEIIVGYYYNHKFYEEVAHTNIIPAEEEVIFVDLSTYSLYVYDNGSYEQVSATGSEGPIVGSNVEVGYYNNNHFYRNRTGSYGGYSYNTVISTNENYIYIDRATGIIYKYDSGSFVPQSPNIRIQGDGKITISYTESASYRDWTVSHNTVTPSTSTVSSTSGDILSSIDTDYYTDSSDVRHYYGHVTSVSKLTFDEAFTASTIVKRLSDAAIKAKYIILDKSNTPSYTLQQTELALFAADGGFTATSYNGNNEYFAGDGLYLDGDEFNIRLDFNTSGENYAVQADSSGNLFVRVPAPSQGTIDHNDLLHRFSDTFTGNITFQHDIDAIRDLRTALNTINTNIGTNANALKLIAQNTWSATAPIIFTHSSTTVADVTTYSNVISIQPFVSVVSNVSENLNSGTLLSTVTEYAEDVDVEDPETHVVTKKRVLTKIPVSYSNAITNNTIVKRRADGALAATYLLITDGVGSATVNQGEAALYIGDGGYTSYSNDNNYTLVTNWPSSQGTAPLSTDDSVFSAYTIYNKINEVIALINTGGGGTPSPVNPDITGNITLRNLFVDQLETSTKDIKIAEDLFALRYGNTNIGLIHSGNLTASDIDSQAAPQSQTAAVVTASSVSGNTGETYVEINILGGNNTISVNSPNNRISVPTLTISAAMNTGDAPSEWYVQLLAVNSNGEVKLGEEGTYNALNNTTYSTVSSVLPVGSWRIVCKISVSSISASQQISVTNVSSSNNVTVTHYKMASGTEIANNGFRTIWSSTGNPSQGLEATSAGTSLIRDGERLIIMGSSECGGVEYVYPNQTITDNDMIDAVLYVKLKQTSS